MLSIVAICLQNQQETKIIIIVDLFQIMNSTSIYLLETPQVQQIKK